MELTANEAIMPWGAQLSLPGMSGSQWSLVLGDWVLGIEMAWWNMDRGWTAKCLLVYHLHPEVGFFVCFFTVGGDWRGNLHMVWCSSLPI